MKLTSLALTSISLIAIASARPALPGDEDWGAIDDVLEIEAAVLVAAIEAAPLPVMTVPVTAAVIAADPAAVAAAVDVPGAAGAAYGQWIPVIAADAFPSADAIEHRIKLREDEIITLRALADANPVDSLRFGKALVFLERLQTAKHAVAFTRLGASFADWEAQDQHQAAITGPRLLPLQGLTLALGIAQARNRAIASLSNSHVVRRTRAINDLEYHIQRLIKQEHEWVEYSHVEPVNLYQMRRDLPVAVTSWEHAVARDQAVQEHMTQMDAILDSNTVGDISLADRMNMFIVRSGHYGVGLEPAFMETVAILDT